MNVPVRFTSSTRRHSSSSYSSTGRSQPRDPRVVDEDIKAAVPLQPVRDKGVHRVGIGHVEAGKVATHDLQRVLAEPLRDGGSKPAGATRDDGDLATPELSESVDRLLHSPLEGPPLDRP